ncbi:MAG: hypothetical protein ACJAXN_002338 [Psychromonas sp.]
MSFREAESKVYAQDGRRNLATIRRSLLNLIKEHSLKNSVPGEI